MNDWERPPIPSPWPEPKTPVSATATTRDTNVDAPVKTDAPLLQCPYCATRFPLTWRRYAASGLGVYSCPQCKKRSKLHAPPALRALEILLTCFVSAPCGALGFALGIMLTHSALGILPGVPGALLGALIPAWLLDRAFEARYGTLHARRGE